VYLCHGLGTEDHFARDNEVVTSLDKSSRSLKEGVRGDEIEVRIPEALS